MAISFDYVNGVIAVKETHLLSGRINKMCEGSAEEAFRTLQENGFGKGAEVESVYEYEALLAADNADVDNFIRTYAPSKTVLEYLFAPRDYHNAKAYIKAAALSSDPSKMLAGKGRYSPEEVKAYVDGDKDAKIDDDLKSAIDGAKKLFEGEEKATGAEIGAYFEEAQNAHLLKVCSKSPLLKKFLKEKADMGNVLAVMRASSEEHAKKNMISGGNVPIGKMLALFSEDEENADNALKGTRLDKFWRECLAVRRKGLPQTEAERRLAGFEEHFFMENKYTLKRSQPFLYYVFRRRAENANVRIVLSLLLAGVESDDIKARLRSFE